MTFRIHPLPSADGPDLVADVAGVAHVQTTISVSSPPPVACGDVQAGS